MLSSAVYGWKVAIFPAFWNSVITMKEPRDRQNTIPSGIDLRDRPCLDIPSANFPAATYMHHGQSMARNPKKKGHCFSAS